MYGKLRLAMLAAAMFAVPTLGHALTWNLTEDHCTGSCGTAVPFGQVDVTLGNSGTLDFVVALAQGNKFVNTGLNTFSFSLVNSPVVGITDYPSGWVVGSGGAGDGFGTFGYSLQWTVGNGASNATADPLTFTVAKPDQSPLTLADIAPNARAYYFAADIIGNNSKTGPVAAVPEPKNYALMLAGLGLVGLIARRRLQCA